MAKTGRFWRNVVLIALVHVALIAVMIRWSLAARASTNAESIVWLGGAEDFTAGKENEVPPAAKQATPPVEAKPSRDNEADSDKPVVTTAKSEIELPSPAPVPTSSPKPTATPTPKSKTTPKVISKPTPKKTLVAKASPRPSPKTKTSAVKSSEKSDKNKKNALAKNELQSQTGSGKIASTGKGASASGGGGASEFGWYGNMLHDRFYSAWIQPTTHVPTGAKISTLVKVRIEKDGRVSKFEIIKPSGNVVVNESVRVVAKQVTQVDPPPAGLGNGDHYDVKINFELNTEEGPEER
ncbi:MAG: TonB C-terminal domain-containing protein [Candidatus Udaeobacter sp.]